MPRMKVPTVAPPPIPAPVPRPRLRPPVAVQPDADLDRAQRFGHRFEPLPTPATQRPIRSVSGRRANERQPLIDWTPPIGPETHQAIATSDVSTAQKGLSLVSGLGSGAQLGARAADFADAQGIPGRLLPGLGMATSPVAAVGSLTEGGVKLHQAVTGGEKAGDKALLGLEATSSFANATVSGASTARYTGPFFGGSAAAAMSVAGPAALAMGGADIVGGAIGNRLAAHREKKLARIEENAGGFESGVARFAKESQQTKKKRHLGSILKGGLAVGGGIALLAGAGPIGWGLLGGAALVGGALGLYKQYRKHKLGKQILADPDYRRQLTTGNNLRIPDARDLASQSWTKRWNPLNTKASRTHDLIRGQIADHLDRHTHRSGHDDRQNDDADNAPLDAVVGLLGLRNKGPKKARAQDIARGLEG